MFYSYRKVVKKTTADGKTVEETVEESSGPEAKAKMDEASKEMDTQFAKMDKFFQKMDEAFKELR
jgi:hypothetical protein